MLGHHIYNLAIRSGEDSYILVYDPGSRRLYIPDYFPDARSVTINYLQDNKIISTRLVNKADFLASQPLRLNGQRYSQYLQAEPDKAAGPSPTSIEILIENYSPVQCPYEHLRLEQHLGIWFAGIRNGSPCLGLESNTESQPFETRIRTLFKEFYGLDPEIQENRIVLRSSEDIWATYKKKPASTGTILEYELESGELPIWQPDLVWVASLGLRLSQSAQTTPSEDLESNTEIIYTSTPVSCSQHDYALLAGGGRIIDLSKLNMNIYNLRLADITTQTVVNMTSKSDSKSNIIQPVFFRVRESARIIVHPEVTENISINLDSYKSGVSTFYLRLEGVSFEEIGRTGNGVIFKIKGSLLSNEISSGTYYILNQDGDLVTTGKYLYET